MMINSYERVGRWAYAIFISCVYLFLYVPIAVLVVFSCNTASFPAPWKGFTFMWYYQLMHETLLWRAVSNSLIIAVSATILSLLIGVIIVMYLAYERKRTSNFIHLFYVNILVPEVVLAVALVSFFTFFSVPLGLHTLVIAHTILGTSYVVPLIYARYNELDLRLIEASFDLGATYGQTFFRVILPLLAPVLVGAGLLVFILSFDDFVLSYFCAGGGSQTLSLYILASLRSGVTPVLNALSTVLLLISSILVFALCALTVKTKLL